MVLMPLSAAVGAWIQDTVHSRELPSPLAQLRRRLLATKNSVGKMRSKKSKDHNDPAVRIADPSGSYGGHNPSGRIRILKL